MIILRQEHEDNLFASDHALFFKPVIGIEIVSAEELPNKDVIKCIQKDNNSKTRSKFQAEHTEILEQSGIKRTRIKQAQKRVQQVKERREGRKTHQ